MTFRRVDRCVHRAFRGTVILLDASGEGHELVGAAAAAWIALDEPGGRAEIAARLVDADVLIGSDDAALARALDLLVERGLVEDDSRPAPSPAPGAP